MARPPAPLTELQALATLAQVAIYGDRRDVARTFPEALDFS